jgi:hypothetical protein
MEKGESLTLPGIELQQVVRLDISLLNICGFHGGDYEEWRLLGCYDVWLL